MDCSTLGFPVPHHIPEFAEVHVHSTGDDIQPAHPLPEYLRPNQGTSLSFPSQVAICHTLS